MYDSLVPASSSNISLVVHSLFFQRNLFNIDIKLNTLIIVDGVSLEMQICSYFRSWKVYFDIIQTTNIYLFIQYISYLTSVLTSYLAVLPFMAAQTNLQHSLLHHE